MTVGTSPLATSVRVVAVGDRDALIRGRPIDFRHEGLAVVNRATGLGALLALGRHPRAIALVPTDMEDLPLLEFVDVLRSVAHVPVIAGVAEGCPTQTVSELFDHGISSVVKLPVTPAQLVEATHSAQVLEPVNPLVLKIGNLTLDDSGYLVTWHGQPVAITPRSYTLLRYMMAAHPRVLTMRELIHEFEDPSSEPGVRTRVTIGQLRAAFKEAVPHESTPIETVHRVGYRLCP
ncbi:winged helix-turn-helix domain-containing protein [Demequina sp. SO4-18]|uniref:winged helix-turn-helix domain-containing protein n=1 Tax=Demequina sp. SO4-18 TaxID=3401026 RepID=UPI003B5A37DF